MSNRFERMPKWRQTLLLTVLCAFLLIVLGLVGELILHLRHNDSAAGDLGAIVIDPELSLPVLRPNSRPSGFFINAQGFRSPKIDTVKPAGRIRLAFLGASTTFNAEVEDNTQTWPYLVVAQLRKAYPDISFDFLNASVSGYSINSSRRAFVFKVKAFKPDIVIVYHGTNDLYKNSRNQAVVDGIVTPEAAKPGWLERRSRLVDYLIKNTTVFWRSLFPNQNTITVDQEKVVAPYAAQLAGLVGEIQAACGLPVLVGFTPRIRADQTAEQQHQAAVTNRYYMPFMSHAGLIKGYQLYFDLSAQIAVEHGIPFVGDAAAIPGDAKHYTDSVHFTVLGNAAMAERVAKGLLRQIAFDRLSPDACLKDSWRRQETGP